MEDRLIKILDYVKDLTRTKGGVYVLGILSSSIPCYFIVEFNSNSIERERTINEQLKLENKELVVKNTKLLESINLAYKKGTEECEGRLVKYKELLKQLTE